MWARFVREPAEVYSQLIEAFKDVKVSTLDDAFFIDDKKIWEKDMKSVKKSKKKDEGLFDSQLLFFIVTA